MCPCDAQLILSRVDAYSPPLTQPCGFTPLTGLQGPHPPGSLPHPRCWHTDNWDKKDVSQCSPWRVPDYKLGVGLSGRALLAL